jgi:hypothetical protein
MRYVFIISCKVKNVSCPCAKLIKHYAIMTYGGVDIWIHVFLTSELVSCKGDKWKT